MLKKEIKTTPRSPSDFKDKIKLYIVGIPIDYSLENQQTIIEFKNLLIKAKSDFWPVYMGAKPEYYQYLTQDGWKTVEQIGIPVYSIYTFTKTIRERYVLMANALYKLAMTSSSPIISLHPGSPRIGDLPVELLLKKFKSKKNQIELLDAKSGLDIVGDLAEKITKKSGFTRQYISSSEALKLKNSSRINGDLLLIYCIANEYSNGSKQLFSLVIIKLFQLGLGNKPVFIKSPKKDGVIMTVVELLEKIQEFDPNDHYTLAVINN